MVDAAVLPGPGRIAADDLGNLERTERVLAGLTDGLGRNFGLSDESTKSTRFATGDIAVPTVEAERLDEWKQALFVLGYLSREAAVSADENSDELVQAAREFRDEISLVSELSRMPGMVDDPDMPEAAPTETELALLAGLTSLDGDLKLPGMPGAGEQNIFTRIVHFRLKALGLFEFDISRPFDERSRDAMDVFAALLAPFKPADPDRPEGPELLEQAKKRARIREWTHDIPGDIKQIAHLYLDSHAHRPLFFRTANLPDVPAKSDYDKLYVHTGKFKEVSWHDRYHDSVQYDLALKEIKERGPLEARVYDSWNQFGLRLVQIKLWMYGYYEGLMDGRFGPESQEALRLALKTEGLDLDDCLRVLEGGHEALNLNFLNRALFGLYEQPEPTASELASALEKESAYLAGKEDDSYFAKIKRTVSGAWGGVKRAVRGAYRGVKSMFQAALRVLHRGYSWLVQWLAKLKAGIINFVSAIFGRLREGLRLIVRSAKAFFNFVLGRPVVTLDANGKPMAASRFNLDADVTTIISANAPDEYIEKHAHRCVVFMHNASAFAAVTVQIVGIIRDIALAGTPLTWISLAFRIAGMFNFSGGALAR